MHASAGQTVAAGAPLFDLVRLDTVWVRVPLYAGESDDIDRARAGAHRAASALRHGGRGTIGAGPVTAPPSADPSTAAVDLYFAVANPSAALASRPARRRARSRSRSDAHSLVVPRAALLHDAYGGTWVYEARDAHVFVRRRVAVVDLVGRLRRARSQGPPPGTRVVTAGAAELFGTEFGAGK